ncbi:MAG TPA: hypothetical protein VFL04_08120 [Rectinemataceae bacterium]|nr:hypothetical protein [Rectinemataceae bacterium]
MKRIIVVFVLLALVAAGLAADTSAYYPVRLDVVKVYTHADGYRVLFMSGYAGVKDTYLPIKWFQDSRDSSGQLLPPKAVLIRGGDPSFPYLVLFYKDGKFDHLRLYVQDSLKDPMWGVMAPSEGVGKFDAQDLDIKF